MLREKNMSETCICFRPSVSIYSTSSPGEGKSYHSISARAKGKSSVKSAQFLLSHIYTHQGQTIQSSNKRGFLSL